ncbi:MAG: sigma-54 dependent transcriptional regulator [Bacteroidales bacterium]|nr:sigma-54 dependent transcriptional regulator [Bacteroidales bacterium]
MEGLQLLLVDDEPDFLSELSEAIDDPDNVVTTAETPTKALEILEQSEIDIAVLDINMPQMNGLQLLERIKKNWPEIEVIMITGQGDMDSVIKAMRLGATDYFTKPFRQIEFQGAIERTRKFKQLHHKLEKVKNQYKFLSDELNGKIGTQIIGSSTHTHNIINLMNKVANAGDTSVLITGESGTGKELVARGIHFLSNRKDNYFHSVNCSAIPESLFESEFFGYNKGAFTGANNNKTGWFEISNGGTLFLDEIGDMQLNLQAKFLRVLDEKIITRVGSHKRIDLDVRIIAATNQDLEKLVEQNRFREDLYHRLNSFTIHIPPLRERKEDIAHLAEHFIDHYAQKLKKDIKIIDSGVYDYLKNLPFYGNVRELKNLIERAVIMCDSDTFDLRYLNNHKNNKKNGSAKDFTPETLNLEELEKNAIVKALELSSNNKTKAAKLLNISRQALDRRIQKMGMDI